MIKTTFYLTTTPLSQAHRAAFTTCHQEHFPGNELAVIENVAGDQFLVKCCGDMTLPDGFVCLGTYTLEQARVLMQQPEWKREMVMP